MSKYSLVEFNNGMYGVKKSSWFRRDSYLSNTTDSFFDTELQIKSFCTMTLGEAKAQLRFIKPYKVLKVLPSKEMAEDE